MSTRSYKIGSAKLELRSTCKLSIFLALTVWYLRFINLSVEASRGAGEQRVTVKSTGCGFDPHSMRWIIYLHLCFFISSLWCWGKARRWVPLLNTQCLQNLVESGELNILTLGSLWLPCGIQREADLFKKNHFIIINESIFYIY